MGFTLSVRVSCRRGFVDVRAESRLAQHEEAVNPNANMTITSQYLHVSESDDLPPPHPPFAVFSAKSAAAASAKSDKFHLEHMYSVEKDPLDCEVGVDERFCDHSYMNGDVWKPSTQQSCSAGNLLQYVGMSGNSAKTTAHSYMNNGADGGVYSYARTFDRMLPLQGASSSAPNSMRSKLKKTSSIPSVLDADRGASLAAQNRGDPSTGSDYVPASPPSAAVSNASGSDAGAASRLSDPVTSPAVSSVASPTGSLSPAIVSPVAGISMSTRSRVFTRQK